MGSCWCFIFRGSVGFQKRKNQRLVDKAPLGGGDEIEFYLTCYCVVQPTLKQTFWNSEGGKMRVTKRD